MDGKQRGKRGCVFCAGWSYAPRRMSGQPVARTGVGAARLGLPSGVGRGVFCGKEKKKRANIGWKIGRDPYDMRFQFESDRKGRAVGDKGKF